MKKYRVTGRVQGVGFRFYTCAQARSLGVSGWVRNRADGSVEAFAAGSEGQLAIFEEAVRRGPTGSRVTGLEICDAEDEHLDGSFEILY